MPLVERAIAVVETHRAQDAVVLAGVHQQRPGWPLEMIYTGRLADPAHAAHACGATLVSAEPEFCLERDIQALHAGGVAVLTTLRSPAHAPDLLRWGLDVFESDDAGMVASALGVAPRA